MDLEGSGENVSVDCDIETISGIYFVPCKTILSCIEKDRVPCKTGLTKGSVCVRQA